MAEGRAGDGEVNEGRRVSPRLAGEAPRGGIGESASPAAGQATRKRREAERARGGGEGSEAGPDEVEAREPTSRVVRRAGLRARR